MILKFRQAEGFNVTIHTNNNCTLKCSYCYEINKPASIEEDQKFWATTKHASAERNYDFVKKRKNLCNSVVSIDKVKTFIDQILEFDKTDFFKKLITSRGNLILDFVGGDSLQYPELLDEILTYFSQQVIKRDSIWKYAWIVSISSNGVTLLNPKAKQFCEKWQGVISIGLSIDGCPELHDLNRWCFADNPDGSHRGSWQYIKEIWPWYQKTFPNDSLRTKWTLAPNSYKYMYKSVKFLHEELKMCYVFFNRVMEDYVQDTAEDLWELIQQFDKTINYLVEHHLDLECSTFGYINTAKKTKSQQREEDSNWSRCGFGKMPALGLDGNVYPCFRMLPEHNHISPDKVGEFRQGTYDSIISNQDMLLTLNVNSQAGNLVNPEKCETCEFYVACPHCAADCVDEHNCKLAKTTSVCNFTRLQVYFSRKYWETIKRLHPDLYRNYQITWTQKEQDKLLTTVLEEIVNLKDKENNQNGKN
jgi:uncharacterized protein